MSNTDLEIVATFLAIIAVFFAGMFAIECSRSNVLNKALDGWKTLCDDWEDICKETAQQRDCWRDKYLATINPKKEDNEGWTTIYEAPEGGGIVIQPGESVTFTATLDVPTRKEGDK